MAAIKAKHQRLILILLALAALVGAAMIAAKALQEEASYFYTPATLKQAEIAPGDAIRLGGMVQVGSIQRSEDGATVRFTVQDADATIDVQYRGITPDLFVEGSGVVADGRINTEGVFVADSLLARHDENYTPRELEDIDMEAAQKAVNTLSEDSGGAYGKAKDAAAK